MPEVYNAAVFARATAVSVAVAVLGAAYPAAKASRLSPVEAFEV